ncbi:Retrovirus-related Pol polyprotein from transposon 412 [Anthophora retusa]
MHSVKDPSSRLLRWRLKLAEYEYKVVYKAGKRNVNADALSRNPDTTAVLPVSSDSSDIPIFESRHQPVDIPSTSNDTQFPQSLPSPIPSILPEQHVEAHLETDSDMTETPHRIIKYSRDRLIMRNDNLACFMTLDNHPVDTGATDLLLHNRLPAMTNATIGRAKVTQTGKYALIQLPVKLSPAHTAEHADVIECIRALHDAVMELGLTSFSISRTAIDETPWNAIRESVSELFTGTNVNIFACSNEIRIPSEDQRQAIISENHISAYAGHKGITKTFRRVREKYFWPSMKLDIANFVNTCRDCQLRKLTRVKTRAPMTLTDTPGRAFDKISLDVVGPLPTTPSGNQYILTMQDLLTKYSLAVPLKSLATTETADAFINTLICRFGTPKAILTDQGTNFTSALMRAVAKRFKIQQFRATAFHPQTNGSIERSHLVLTEYLKHYVKRNNWDEWLNCAMFSYNTSVHEGTLFTPHELVFGNKARVPTADTTQTMLDNESYNSYLQNLQDKILASQRLAQENLNAAKNRSKQYYDRKINNQKFSIGDRVLLLKEPRKGKFDAQYSGPYLIVEVLNSTNVRLRLSHNKTKIVHVNKLKHARTPLPTTTASSPPPSTSTVSHLIQNRSEYKTANEVRQEHSVQRKEPDNMDLRATTLCLLVTQAAALIGYDCSGPTLNVSTFSAVDPLDCEAEEKAPIVKERAIQLLQLSEFQSAEVTQCHVEIDRTIFHCGMHSHISAVNNGRQIYLMNIPRDACQMLHRTGTLYVTPSTQITGVATNSSTARSLTLSGKIENDGTCFGSTFSDPYGTWNSVVVQAVIRIKIRTHIAAVKLATNEIILQSGQRCLVQQGSCLDSEDGFSYWDNSPTDYCKFNNYDVLYEGKATLVEDEDNQGLSLYSVTSQGTTFALARTTSTKVCGYTLIHTEHPKLFILETEKEGHFKTRTPIAINNLDIFAYVNSKFVYVEKHLKTQIIQLYRDVVKQKCALERQIMHNAITLIHVTPAEVATTIAKEHGFMAIASGEVIHIVKCIPVVCQVRHTDTCYDELPVTYKNTSLFITPIHHILTRSGTRKDCSELMPNMFRIHGLWYRLTPKPVESLPPTPLKPLTKATWKYVNPHNLADGGIYSPEDLAKLKEHIMFPIERPAIVNSLAQGATGREYSSQALQLYNLFDETTLNKLAESTGKRIWSGFITFGSFTAGIMGIYLAIRVIKAAVSTIINGIALHSVYGWSLHLLGAAWSSLTHFFLFLSQRKTNDEIGDTQANTERTRNPPNPKQADTEEQATETVNQCTLQNERLYPSFKLHSETY